MFGSRSSKTILGALAMAWLAAAPMVWAAGPRQRARVEERRPVPATRQAEPGLLPGAWRRLSSLWEGEGSMIDPNGNHLVTCQGATIPVLTLAGVQCVPVVVH